LDLPAYSPSLTILRLSAWSPQQQLSRREWFQQTATASASAVVLSIGQVVHALSTTDPLIDRHDSDNNNDDFSDSSSKESESDSDSDLDGSDPRGWIGFIRLIPQGIQIKVHIERKLGDPPGAPSFLSSDDFAAGGSASALLLDQASESEFGYLFLSYRYDEYSMQIKGKRVRLKSLNTSGLSNSSAINISKSNSNRSIFDYLRIYS
jgi:hypothetical protein